MSAMSVIAVHCIAPPERADATKNNRYLIPYRSGWMVCAGEGPARGSMLAWVPDTTEGSDLSPLVDAGFGGAVVTAPMEVTARQLRAWYVRQRAEERAEAPTREPFSPGLR